jgi:transposase
MPKHREYTTEERSSVITWRKAGKTYREIEELTNIPHSTCHNIYQKWSQTNTLKPQKRQGSVRKFTPNVIRYIDGLMQKNGDIVASEIKDRLVNKFGDIFASSERQVRNIRKQLGYTPSKGLGQDELTTAQKKERRAYYSTEERTTILLQGSSSGWVQQRHFYRREAMDTW